LTHAALGAVSKGGLGNPEFEVCHRTPSGSIPLIAIQKGGRSGAFTLSNLSSRIVINCPLHGGGVGPVSDSGIVAPSCPKAFDVNPPPVRCAMAREELIAPNTATTAGIKTKGQRISRTRSGVNMRFGFVMQSPGTLVW
jgi:hypothetical protein